MTTPPALVVLPPHERSPAAARRHVRAVLEEVCRADVLDIALLLTTELVTNSVIHAGTPVTLEVTLGSPQVTISVTDGRPTMGDAPQARSGHDHDDALLREGGRGMQLLAALSERWGVVHTGTAKTVWFELGASTAPPTPARGPARIPGDPARRDLAWLTRLGDAIERTLRLDELLREIATRLAEACDADGVRVVAVSSDGAWRDVVCCGVGVGHGGERWRRMRLDEGPPLVSDDLLVAPGPFPPSLVAAGMRSALAVAIRLDDVLLGCLELVAAPLAAFDADAVALAQLVADQPNW